MEGPHSLGTKRYWFVYRYCSVYVVVHMPNFLKYHLQPFESSADPCNCRRCEAIKHDTAKAIKLQRWRIKILLLLLLTGSVRRVDGGNLSSIAHCTNHNKDIVMWVRTDTCYNVITLDTKPIKTTRNMMHYVVHITVRQCFTSNSIHLSNKLLWATGVRKKCLFSQEFIRYDTIFYINMHLKAGRQSI